MASCGIFIVLVSGKPLATLDVRNYALCTTQLCIRVKVSASRDLAFVKQVVFTKHVVCALQQAVMVSHPEPLIFALLTQWTQLEGCTDSKGPTYNATLQHCTWSQNLQCNNTTLYMESKPTSHGSHERESIVVFDKVLAQLVEQIQNFTQIQFNTLPL